MAEFFEYDPLTGIRTDTDWDEATQSMTLTRTTDVEPVLDHAKRRSHEVGKDRAGIKNGWMCYATLPPIVILQMRAKGINIYDNNDQAAMFREINSHYPHLKMVTGNEGGKEKIIV